MNAPLQVSCTYDDGDRNSGGVINDSSCFRRKPKGNTAGEEMGQQRSHHPHGGFNVTPQTQPNNSTGLPYKTAAPPICFFLDCVTLITNTTEGVAGHYCKVKKPLKDQRVSSTEILIPSKKLENKSKKGERRYVYSCHTAVAGSQHSGWRLRDHIQRC